MTDIYSLLEEAYNNSTPGPWVTAEEIDGWMAGRRTVVRTIDPDHFHRSRIVTVDQTRRHDVEHSEANCQFIALAHEQVPHLIQENRLLRKALEEALESKPTSIEIPLSKEALAEIVKEINQNDS